MIAFGTVSDRATIDEIGRALKIPLDKVAKIKDEYTQNPEDTKKKYPEVFYYFDGLVNTVVSQSVHPAGIVISPITLPDNYGILWKDNQPILQVDMEDVHDSGLVKYDILALKNIDIIRDTCIDAGIEYPKVDTVNFEDEAVWNDMCCSKVGLFEFEGDYAFNLLKKFGPHSISDISLVNAALRPSGASYRDRLIARQVNKNPSEKIDELLKDTYCYLLYQEQIIAFLQELCGYTGSEADSCRRMIARKHPEELEAELPKILDGYCKNSDRPREIAEKEASEFVQIVSDASSYMFGKNHSDGYSIVAYFCAYYRYYYPGQFIAAYLNNAGNMEDIQDGSELAKVKGIKIEPPKFRKSVGKYIYDKEENKIYKGISSIKYISDACAEELYSMKHMNFRNFVELLQYIVENTTINSRQLKVLTTINFFEEYGKNGTLLNILEMFFNRYSKNHVEKTKNARIKEIEEYANSLEQAYLSIKEQIAFENEYVGYITFTNDLPKRYVYVQSIDKKYTPRAIIYCMNTGKSINVKVDKREFAKKAKTFSSGDILYCKKFLKRPNWRKTEDGFEKDGTYSDVLVDWDVVKL